MATCPACDGDGVILWLSEYAKRVGALVTTYYRCRDCGVNFQGPDPWTGWGDDTTKAIARAVGLID